MTPLEEVDQIIDTLAGYRAEVRKDHADYRDRDCLIDRLREFILKLRQQDGLED